MFLTALIAKLSAVLATGWAADIGMPVCWAGVVNSIGGIALNFVAGAVVHNYIKGSSIAGPWIMQVVLLGRTGFGLALLPTVGVNIYPAEVRASGYNLSYSLASGLVGGLSPLAVTAIRSTNSQGTSGATAIFGAAFWTLAAGVVSAIAYLVTLVVYPVCNRAAAQPLVSSQRHPMDKRALHDLRSGSISRSGAVVEPSAS